MMAPPGSLFLTLCETHSSRSIRREKSLLFTAPVRIAVVSTVVGDLEPSSPAGLDRVDLFVAPTVEVDIGYPFAAGSLAGPFVFRGVVGDWLLASSSRIYGVDLVTVGPALARVGYLLATRRVGR